MSHGSLFHRSLDVLTCIYNHDMEQEAICEKVELDSAHVEKLIDKLCEWELIDEMSPSNTRFGA